MRHTNIILLVLVLISLTLTSKAFGKEVSETDKEMIKGRSVETRLHHMEKQLDRMYGPINQLNEPVSRLEKPVSRVGNQLDKLKKDLSELKQVVHVTSILILCAIVGAGLFVAIGIPIGGVIAWRYRSKILNKVDQLTPGHEHVYNSNTSQDSHSHTPVGPVISTR